jgi:hypothetical protein
MHSFNHELERRVFDLYGLTDEERALVRGSGGQPASGTGSKE